MIEANLIQISEASKTASRKLATVDTRIIDVLLKNVADSILDRSTEIMEANQADIKAAHDLNLDDHMIDRLLLDKDRIQKIILNFLIIILH